MSGSNDAAVGVDTFTRNTRSSSVKGFGRATESRPQSPKTHLLPPWLKLLLFFTDAAGIAFASWITVILRQPASKHSFAEVLVFGLVALVTTTMALRHQGLYLARVSSQRTLEAQGILRACFIGSALTAAVTSFLPLPIDIFHAALYLLGSSVTLMLSRNMYRAWLSARRRSGVYVRTVLVVGANEEAAEFVDLVDDHPELGYRIAGVLGASPAHTKSPRIEGRIEDAATVAHRLGVSGAVVVASALTAPQLHAVTRDLLSAGIHVHLSTGLAGLSRTRVRPVSLAHEALLYLEPPTLRAWARYMKRAMDIAGSTLALVLTIPLWITVAGLIKLDGQGPVFFAQRRVGMGGRTFPMLKFRTMTPDAEINLSALSADNEREDSPLFKMSTDPRVTRVGRVLRATSLDEMPQLLNVLAGTMSLVGPRPALPSEVDQFDDELKDRLRVKPGITGLWQIEARDHPSFRPYRRLDLFYVENWSLTLDLLILVGTITSVGARILRFVFPFLRTEAAMKPS